MNKKCLESLVQAGALDSLGSIERSRYFAIDPKDNANGIEKAIRFGSALQNKQGSMQNSLFGDDHEETIALPVIPEGSFGITWRSCARKRR